MKNGKKNLCELVTSYLKKQFKTIYSRLNSKSKKMIFKESYFLSRRSVLKLVYVEIYY
jgi:hypothetical protein